MSDGTDIEWTDASWNPVTGCSQVSEGCQFCYAERLSGRYGWTSKPWTSANTAENVREHPEQLEQPLHWRKPRHVLVSSMGDFFHELVDPCFIADCWAIMARARQHVFQILTKRPERMRAILADLEFRSFSGECYTERFGVAPAGERAWPLSNVWLGVSAEDQRWADERIPLLLETPAAVRFVSCEPLLGGIDLSRYLRALDWVIVGGESGGPEERRLVQCDWPWWHPKPVALDWVRSLQRQCVVTGTAFFFKQWGGPVSNSGGRGLDGQVWDEMPRSC